MVKNTKNGQFRPEENVFRIVEVLEVHFRAILGTSNNRPKEDRKIKCRKMLQNAVLGALRFKKNVFYGCELTIIDVFRQSQQFQKMTQIAQKVKGLPFTFLAILDIFSHFWTFVKNTKNSQLRPGENVFLIVEVLEVNFRAFRHFK